MKRVFWTIVFAALIVGAYLQETGGRVESLPAAIQPYARPVHAFCAPGFRYVSSKLAPLLSKLKPSWIASFQSATRKVSRGTKEVLHDDALVINYTDGPDLLSRLKYVPAGQRIELHCTEPGGKTIDTGIKCWDTAAKAAYMKRKEKELSELNQAIEAEMKRIQRIQ